MDEDPNNKYSDGKTYVMTVILEFHNREENPVRIFDIITKEGYLKDGNTMDVNPSNKYLTVFESRDQTPMVQRSFPDPLNKIVEYVDGNGNLAKKEISLDSDVVPLRLNYKKAISLLKIYERDDSDWKLIASFPLTQ